MKTSVLPDIQWKIIEKNINDLKPYTKNPRYVTTKQDKTIQDSLQQFGFCDVIIINQDNEIIGGHQRIRQLKKLGYKTVPVSYPNRLLDEKEVGRLNIFLNQGGSFDYDILSCFWDVDELIDLGFTQENLQVNIDDNENDEEKKTYKCPSCGKKSKEKIDVSTNTKPGD